MKHILITLSTLIITYIFWSIFVLLISPVIGDNHKNVKWNDKTFTETSPTGVLIRKILGTTYPFDVKGETLYRWETTFWFIPTGFEWKTIKDIQRQHLLEYLGEEKQYIKYVSNIENGEPNGLELKKMNDLQIQHLLEYEEKWKSFERGIPYPKYVGDIENGVPNGFGMIGYPDSGNWYVGEWKDGEFNGKGKLTIYSVPYSFIKEYFNISSNEGEYIGDWKDGERNGHGTFTWSGGEKYVGSWKDGMELGQGTLTYPYGYKKVGEWRKLPLGISFLWKGTYYHEDGTIISEFVNGYVKRQ